MKKERKAVRECLVSSGEKRRLGLKGRRRNQPSHVASCPFGVERGSAPKYPLGVNPILIDSTLILGYIYHLVYNKFNYEI